MSGAQLRQAPAAHPLGDERSFVLGHRSPYLQQELVVGVLAHGPLQELYPTAATLQFFEEQYLVDVVARQPVRGGHEHHLELGHRRRVAQGVEAGTVQARAAVALVEVDALPVEDPAHLLGVVLKPLRPAGRSCGPALGAGSKPERRSLRASGTSSSVAFLRCRPSEEVQVGLVPATGGVGAADRRASNRPVPFHRSLPDGRLLEEGIRAVWASSFSRLRRTKQNLSFVISPSRRFATVGTRRGSMRQAQPLLSR